MVISKIDVYLQRIKRSFFDVHSHLDNMALYPQSSHTFNNNRP